MAEEKSKIDVLFPELPDPNTPEYREAMLARGEGRDAGARELERKAKELDEQKEKWAQKKDLTNPVETFALVICARCKNSFKCVGKKGPGMARDNCLKSIVAIYCAENSSFIKVGEKAAGKKRGRPAGKPNSPKTKDESEKVIEFKGDKIVEYKGNDKDDSWDEPEETPKNTEEKTTQ